MYKINLIIFILIQFTIVSCNSTQNDHISSDKSQTFRNVSFADLKEIFSSKSKAVYLSYDTLKPFFGKIALVDLISKKSVVLLDNEFYNSSPIFFENGTILFASARLGNFERLKIVSYHARRQLYVLNCDDIVPHPFFTDETNDILKLIKFNGLLWDTKRKHLFFANEDNSIISFSTEYKKPKLLFSLKPDTRIWDIKQSPNKEYLAFDYFDNSTNQSFIGVYSISGDSIIVRLKGEGAGIYLLGWSFDNRVYFREHGFKILDPNLGSIISVNFNLNEEDFLLKKILPEDGQNLIFLIDKLRYNTKIGYSISTSSEIARYNLKLRTLEWLTNDGQKKEDLCISFE